MLHKVTSLRDFKRKVSPPQPVFMTDDQKSDYLTGLRSDRPPRPSGSRPPPFKTSTYPSPAKQSLLPQTSSTSHVQTSEPATNGHLRGSEHRHASEVPAPHHHIKSPAPSTSSARLRTGLGRPLVAGPENSSCYSVRGRKVSPTAAIQAPAPEEPARYRESGARWMERQEAISLREALKVMDQKDEERKIHEAAQDEAADLVWRHRNPRAAENEKSRPFRNPDITPNHQLKAHLQKGAHARSQSVATAESGQGIPTSASYGSMSQTSNRSSIGTDQGPLTVSNRHSTAVTGAEELHAGVQATHSLPKESAAIPALPNMPANRRRGSGQRAISSGSSKGVFRNPEDQIYEEPEEGPTSELTLQAPKVEGGLPLNSRPRNALPQGSRPLPRHSSTMPESGKLDRFEIYKNPPTQSRNAAYTANVATPPPAIELIPEYDALASKDGIEIRGEDIRAATTMRMKDRSPKLPTPTAVSDVPGRPIVSFDKRWQPAEDTICPDDAVERQSIRPGLVVPVMTVSAPAVPTINLPGDAEADSTGPLQEAPPIPLINLPDNTPIPVISISASEPTASPTIAVSSATTETKARPLPITSKSSPAPTTSPKKPTSRLPWLNPTSRAGVPTATCANCTLPIAGRIVTASGSSSSSSSSRFLKAMFHPECFTCHACSTPLESVAFYPEPEAKRRERLCAADGLTPDSESDIRFFCHLDFHEFFSPRCKNCKTPIEGEVVLAAGAEWHVGHFFCAECGDPFDAATPFVERDGYAYCVRCHTRRTSARCRACKGQILDETSVEALGGKWHEECFVCCECGSGFGDEGRFFVREVEVEGTEKEKRRGILTKREERAVCQGCEEVRLKA